MKETQTCKKPTDKPIHSIKSVKQGGEEYLDVTIRFNSQDFTDEYKKGFKIVNFADDEKMRNYIWELEDIKRKWNCKHCRDSYERGGCPDHGPSVTGKNFL